MAVLLGMHGCVCRLVLIEDVTLNVRPLPGKSFASSSVSSVGERCFLDAPFLQVSYSHAMAGPVVTDESKLGALGVRIVEAIVHDQLRHLFRPRERRDLGIDGEIELVDEVDEKRRGSGRLIALQIKCGESFFREQDEDDLIFRGEPKHLNYWSDFSLPVLIVLCHPVTREAYWAEFNPAAVTVLESGWKIRIPLRNRLVTADRAIQEIARRNHITDLIDLAAQSWVHASHAERVEFCGIYHMPRDYHWYQHLVRIGEETMMLHWLYARYGRFEIQEVRDALRYLPNNRVYASKLILCFVAETIEPLRLNKEIRNLVSKEAAVEVRLLLFRRQGGFIGALDGDGNVVVEYYAGAPVHRENANGEWIG